MRYGGEAAGGSCRVASCLVPQLRLDPGCTSGLTKACDAPRAGRCLAGSSLTSMTTYVVEVPLAEENQSVWIEVAPSDVGEGIELVSDDAGRAVARLGRTLEASLEPVQAFVSTTIDKLRCAKHAPDGVQVQFALKLG